MTLARNAQDRPPLPMVLGGYHAPPRAKLERPHAQLLWAAERGGLDQAMGWLDEIAGK